MTTKTSEFARGWVVLLACLIGVACGASPIPFNTIGFFMPELNKEFGWGFGEMSLGITIYGVLAALLAPVFGAWADRYGAKRVAMASMGLFGLAFAAFALTPDSIWGFYGIWVAVGLVGIGSTPVTFSRLVNQWYFKRRGLALRTDDGNWTLAAECDNCFNKIYNQSSLSNYTYISPPGTWTIRARRKF